MEEYAMAMDAQERRNQILAILNSTHEPVTAQSIAAELGVDRTVVISDIAILRTGGIEIMPTVNGYVLDRVEQGTGFTTTFAVRHTSDQLLDELYCIVDNGGTVVDVIVEHPVYGQLRGYLNIDSRAAADRFSEALRNSNAAPISTTTEGVHIHTIQYKNLDAIQKIKMALKEKGFLLE